MSTNIGQIIGINGNLLKVNFQQPVILNEVAYACIESSDLKLKSEVQFQTSEELKMVMKLLLQRIHLLQQLEP